MKAEPETTLTESSAPHTAQMSENWMDKSGREMMEGMKNHVPHPRPPLRQPETQADRWIRRADQATKQQSD